MISTPLFGVAVVLIGFAILVWKASPDRAINRRFTTFTLIAAMWVTGVAGAHTGSNMILWVGVAFAAGTLIPVAFLALIATLGPTTPTLPRFVFPISVTSG